MSKSVLTDEDIEVLKVGDAGCMGEYRPGDWGCRALCEYLDLCKRLAEGEGATLELIAYFEEKYGEAE